MQEIKSSTKTPLRSFFLIYRYNNRTKVLINNTNFLYFAERNVYNIVIE